MEIISDDDNDYSFITEFFEIFEKYDKVYNILVEELEKFNMTETLGYIKQKIYENFLERKKERNDFEDPEELVKKGKLKFMLKRKSKLPNLNENIEIILEQSIKGLFPNSKLSGNHVMKFLVKKEKKI